MTMYDSAGQVTTVTADAVKREYFITVKKLIATESVASILIVKTTTAATITVT